MRERSFMDCESCTPETGHRQRGCILEQEHNSDALERAALADCPNCNFPMVWASEAPGASGYRCKVCELRAENDLIRESRQQFHDLLITAFEKLIWLGYPVEEFPGITDDLLAKAWKQVRDHESFS
jgi:hypothetical protein